MSRINPSLLSKVKVTKDATERLEIDKYISIEHLEWLKNDLIGIALTAIDAIHPQSGTGIAASFKDILKSALYHRSEFIIKSFSESLPDTRDYNEIAKDMGGLEENEG